MDYVELESPNSSWPQVIRHLVFSILGLSGPGCEHNRKLPLEGSPLIRLHPLPWHFPGVSKGKFKDVMPVPASWDLSTLPKGRKSLQGRKKKRPSSTNPQPEREGPASPSGLGQLGQKQGHSWEESKKRKWRAESGQRGRKKCNKCDEWQKGGRRKGRRDKRWMAKKGGKNKESLERVKQRLEERNRRRVIYR